MPGKRPRDGYFMCLCGRLFTVRPFQQLRKVTWSWSH